MYFNEITSYNNLTYSIDKIRLKTYIDYDVWSNLDYYFRCFYLDKIINYWISDKISQFKYNYSIELEEGVVLYVGFSHNNEKHDEHKGLYNLTIEFNPNKMKYRPIIKHIINLSGDWFVRSYDLSVDVKMNILDLIVDKGLKRKMKVFTNGYDDITYEIGTGDKRLKIYNKKIESKLQIPGNLTRIEISRQMEDFPVGYAKLFNYPVEEFPEIYTNDYIVSLFDYKMDRTLLVHVFAVQSGFPLNKVSRTYKSKIKKLFEGGHKIRFTSKDATMAFRKTLYSYFINNPKVHWK